MKANFYTVKQLAVLAGVTVKTLHLYDKIGLVKPSVRTEARYRLYGKDELLRLQQVLFYRELGMALKEIGKIMNDPDFDLRRALEDHQKALTLKRKHLARLLKTVSNTLNSLKNNTMLNTDELYDGLSAEEAKSYRAEAIAAYGAEVVEHAENKLRKLNKNEIKDLVATQKEIAAQLAAVQMLDPAQAEVQALVARHYQNTRKLWGTEHASDKQAEAYKGLGMLYLTDERFTLVDNRYNYEFALFLSKAMAVFSDNELF